MYLTSSGQGTVETYLSPSLPFVPGRGLRFAVSFDDAAPTVVEVTARAGDPEWSRSVEDNIRIVRTPMALSGPGIHSLKVWGVDPGVVLQKIVVNLGGERPSYLGPPESFFWIPAKNPASP